MSVHSAAEEEADALTLRVPLGHHGLEAPAPVGNFQLPGIGGEGIWTLILFLMLGSRVVS